MFGDSCASAGDIEELVELLGEKSFAAPPLAKANVIKLAAAEKNEGDCKLWR